MIAVQKRKEQKGKVYHLRGTCTRLNNPSVHYNALVDRVSTADGLLQRYEEPRIHRSFARFSIVKQGDCLQGVTNRNFEIAKSHSESGKLQQDNFIVIWGSDYEDDLQSKVPKPAKKSQEGPIVACAIAASARYAALWLLHRHMATSGK